MSTLRVLLLQLFSGFGGSKRVDHGADVNAVLSEDGDTPLHFIARWSYGWNYYDIVYYLVEHGADVNSQNIIGETPLHCVALRQSGCSLGVAQFLVERGSYVYAEDHGRRTALYNAVKSGNLELVRWLVEQGLDVNVQDRFGDTPLHYIRYTAKGFEVARYLIEHGADVNIRNNHGSTIMSNPSLSSHKEFEEYLREHIKSTVLSPLF